MQQERISEFGFWDELWQREFKLLWEFQDNARAGDSAGPRPLETIEAGRHYCPVCRSAERTKIEVSPEVLITIERHQLYRRTALKKNAVEKRQVWQGSASSKTPRVVSEHHVPLPIVFSATCLRCGEAEFTILCYEGPDGPAAAVFPTQHGAGTPNTPSEIAYYLEQAALARSVGAYSATASMFRAALEMLLFKAGFKEKMFGRKLGELELAIKAGNAPVWATAQKGFLDLLKRLGDGAIHPGDGDITRQAALDHDVVNAIETVVGDILREVYEVGKHTSSLESNLRAALDKLDPPAAGSSAPAKAP